MTTPQRVTTLLCWTLASAQLAHAQIESAAPDQLWRLVVRLEVGQDGRVIRQGSGVVLGYRERRVFVLTAFHVVVGDSAERRWSDWRAHRVNARFRQRPDAPFVGRLFQEDEAHDLAVVVFDGVDVPAVGLTWGVTLGHMRLAGHPVLGLGYPEGQEVTLPLVLGRVFADSIWLSGPLIKEGLSGGPALDKATGALLGIIVRGGTSRIHAGTAVAADVVRQWLAGPRVGLGDLLVDRPASSPMVLVTAQAGGQLPIGADGRATVKQFLVDEYEVSQREYDRFVRDSGLTPVEEYTCERAKGTPADAPAVCVSWGEADAFCRGAGKRLPTAGEWRRAAAGARRTVRSKEPLLSRVVPARNADPADVSTVGARDMAGGVSEWVADWAPDPDGRAIERYRLLLGGSYVAGEAEGISAQFHNLPDDNVRRQEYGFRCAADLAQ